MLIAKNGLAFHKIVYPANGSPPQRHAARELSHYLSRMTGADFYVISDIVPKSGCEIYIGEARKLNISALPPNSPEDSYRYHVEEGNLFLTGEGPRGVLYSVYAFLEDICGCRFFARDCSIIPKYSELLLNPNLDVYSAPAFRYREIFYNDIFDGDFAARRRLNGDHQKLFAEHGGKLSYVPGYFVHSFTHSLVPPSKYYESHPEYFALKDGVRQSSNSPQLCLTNPDVLKIATEQALEDLRAHPNSSIISISQDDGGAGCACHNCAKIVELEGSESGPIIRFVNSVAEEIEKEFPHVWVDTLAYDYSRKPPRFVKPRKNVIVRLCSFECCFSHPLRECPEIADSKKAGTPKYLENFAQDLKDWAKISDQLFIWDYVTDFELYHNIHPNFQVLQDNMQFFRDNNVCGVFSQGNGQSPSGEMAELRAYLLAKLSWDPDYDVEQGTAEFLDAWYGPAAPFINEYLEVSKDALLKTGYHLSLSDSPKMPFITAQFLEKIDTLFDEAERVVSDNILYSTRIKKERIAIRLTKFFHSPPDDDRSSQVEQFIADARALGIKRFSEKWGYSNIKQFGNRGVWPPHPDDMGVIAD